MPTYEYFCEVHGEFEEEHSITIKLTHCSKCKEEGREQEIKRLISLGGKGIVELSGQDLVNQVKSDAKKLQRDAAKSEKIYSNLLGEAKYENLQKQIDRRKH
jgi:putative FmdB family regulatory protein